MDVGLIPVFEEFCRPWLDEARARAPAWDCHPELAEALCAQLSAAAARVLTSELAAWREAGMLRGETPAERWRDFSGRVLALPEMQGHLRTAYPLFFPLLDNLADHFRLNIEEALTRLKARQKDVEILRIDTGLSDPHAKGRSVIRFTFENGEKLIYKPRSVRGEAWWADFVAWWNASGVSPEMQLRAPEAEDHGDYGWCEFIETDDTAEASAWFFRLGVHLAIAWLFGIEDCHFGNFIAAGPHPVLIDAECVGAAFRRPCPPELPADLPWIFTPIGKSPLTGGMFPPWMLPKVPGQPLYQAPGIGGAEDRPLPVKRPGWFGIGTDGLRMELTAGIAPPTGGRKGTPDSPREMAAGFRAAAEHLLGLREEVLEWAGGGGPLDPLQVRPRLLLRNTAAYQQILEAASGPKYLASPEARRMALRTITKFPVIGGAEPEGLADAELSYLDLQTYPRFVVNETGTRVISDDGKSTLLECDPEAPGKLLRQRWRDLTGERIRWNSEIVSAACRQAAETRPVFPHGEKRCLLAALEIGNALERQAIRAPEGAAWLGLSADAHGNVITETPRGDFFSGSAGVAVFLARLGEATGERRFTDLAIEAMRFSDRYWTLAAKLGGSMPWSAYYGAGSLLFAAGSAESLSDSVREILVRWLERANRDRSWLEMNADPLAGLPGWTLALASLPGIPLARDLLRLSLTRILDPALPGSLSTPGLAHGTAGWVMAVTAAARALDDSHAMRSARQVIATFPAKWAEFQTRPSVRNNPPGGWCNGAIGLMAAAAEHPETADCAREFLEKARPHFAGGHGGHHLCCGEAGRILLLSRAAKLLPDESLAADARRCADALLDHVEENGFLILQGIPERLTIPGWMTGISGVGAALLAANSLREDLTI